jgi:F0F1-type ATP synthase membrane subunit b/b'
VVRGGTAAAGLGKEALLAFMPAACAVHAGAIQEQVMARENQGLQIALIIFVMLTVVMSVMTFVYFQKFTEAEKKQKISDEKAQNAESARLQTDSDNQDYKKMMGFAPTLTKQEVVALKDKDMNSYAGAFPGDIHVYSPVLKQLVETIQKKDKLIADKDAENKQQRDEFDTYKAKLDTQVAEFKKVADDSGNKVVDVTKRAQDDRATMAADQQQTEKLIVKIKNDNRAENERAKDEVKKLSSKLDDVVGTNVKLNQRLGSINRTYPDRFCGEVRFVNQRDGAVWIDLGSADGLDRQVTFSVYSGDATNLAKAAKKASIEVTRVTGEHMAMARVLEEEKVTDPIVSGDKIFTPLWSPGEQKHFALVGSLDLDGNGKDDHEAVKNLIALHHGVVDCDVNEKGKRSGDITVNTNYLVCGERPTDKGQPALLAAYIRITTDAERLGVRTISLADLKEQMGYRNPAPVNRFAPTSPVNEQPAKAH